MSFYQRNGEGESKAFRMGKGVRMENGGEMGEGYLQSKLPSGRENLASTSKRCFVSCNPNGAFLKISSQAPSDT